MSYNIKIPKEKSFCQKDIQSHPTLGEPVTWFNNEILQQMNLNKIQFDFFINWSTKQMHNDIWLKRIYDVEDSTQPHIFDIETLRSKITEGDYEHFNAEKYISFFHSKQLNPKYMIIKDRDSADDFCSNQIEITRAVVTELVVNPTLPHTVTHLRLNDLKNQIHQLSGGPLRVNKNLNYSTTALEVYLYKNTTAKWPGDCDLLLFDDDDNCVAIIEFKKHNLSNRPLNNESIEQYMHNQDRRKYQRLGLLRDYFSEIQNTSIPLIVLIYPTYSDESNIKLQSLVGEWDNLTIGSNEILQGPFNEKNKRHLINRIISNLGELNVNQE